MSNGFWEKLVERSGRNQSHSSRGKTPPLHKPLSLECLEDRRVLAPIIVTLLDEGLGVPGGVTLREAVTQANADAGIDTIVFSEVILPSDGSPAVIDLETPLDITEAVEIRGPGAGRLTIDGGYRTQLFSVDYDFVSGNVTNQFTVFQGLTFKRGIAVDGLNPWDQFGTNGRTVFGGAISASNPIEVSDSVFVGNRATAGGAIGVPGTAAGTATGLVVVEDSTFINNEAEATGGAISDPYGVASTALSDPPSVSKSATPSWCLVVMTAYLAPLFLMSRAHSLGRWFSAVKPSSCFM